MTRPDPPRTPGSELLQVDLEDARRARDAADERASRHLVWALLGLSPAALVPFAGFLLEGSWGLLALLIALVFVIESTRYALARREAERLNAVVMRLLEPHPEAPTDPRHQGGQHEA